MRNPPSHILPSHHACTGSVVGFQVYSGIWEFAKTRTPNDTEQSTKTFEEESLDLYDFSMMILFQNKNLALHIHNPPPFLFQAGACKSAVSMSGGIRGETALNSFSSFYTGGKDGQVPTLLRRHNLSKCTTW